MANFSVIDVEQRSEAWFAARTGRLTASQAADMMAKPLKSGGEPAAKRDLRLRLALERITGRPEEEGFVSADMRRGTELEPAALSAYEVLTGTLVFPVGFCQHNELPIGCSPDGVIDGFVGGLELKCPKSATHLGYLKDPGALRRDYCWQIIHTLFVTGADWWDLLSFDPRFPDGMQTVLVRVTRESVDLEDYGGMLREFLGSVDAEVEAIQALRKAA